MSIEAMKLALEALLMVWHSDRNTKHSEAIEALRAAIEQAEKQEPVAWQCQEHGETEWFNCSKEAHELNPRRYIYRALYTAPPQREWQGLTEQDTLQIRAEWEVRDYRLSQLCRAIEAKLKEKNT